MPIGEQKLILIEKVNRNENGRGLSCESVPFHLKPGNTES